MSDSEGSKMSSQDPVRAALQALADHDRSRQSQTPAHIIYARHRPRKWNWGTALGAIGVAAAAMLAAIFMYPSPHVPAPRPPQPPQIAVAEPAPVVLETKPEPQPLPVKHPKRVAPKEPPREVVTDFFPLMDVPPPFERGQLLRVVVPVATMRTVGLPVNPDRLSDRIQADVLIGDEGMARAIRFVSYEQ